MPPPKATAGAPTPWRSVPASFAATSALLLALLYGFVLVLDPYGIRAGSGRPPTPIMDVNQRYMYPQLARSGLFDAAVFGTSTARLLDPRRLDAALGGRFANLAINAGTPWEQLELAKLFARHVPAPTTLVFGLDRAWCDPQADRPDLRLTFRAFPPWLYDDERLNDLPNLLNLKSLEIAGRVLLNRVGMMKARIRGDGYDVFTPPEASYDPARARLHLGQPSAPVVAEGATGSFRFPALGWLAAFAEGLPAATRLVLLFPPLHVSALPEPGSRDEASETACKAQAAELAARPRTTVLDYRWPTALTREDTNFWDKMHYRLPVADEIVRDIAGALAPVRPEASGRYRLLAPPG